MAASGALCAVDGCRSSKRRDKNLSFFSLPADTEIRKTWIELIARPDLARPETKRTSHFVCSLHFDPSVIKYKLQLQPNSLPTKLLPSQPTTSNSSNETKTKECSTQTEYSTMNIISAEDSLQTENEIKLFCPKCNTEVSHTAEGIQEEANDHDQDESSFDKKKVEKCCLQSQDQIKLLIAKVYHYFEQEYEELKTIYGDLDLTPLSKFRQRTALATGVTETKVLEILKEEEGRNADKRQEPPGKRRTAPKRSRQTDSSSEEGSSDDNADDDGESSNANDAQMVIVKEELPEYDNEEPEIFVSAVVKGESSYIEVKKEQPQNDPISLDLKTEPRSDVVDNENETLAVNEPAGTKRKGRKIPRTSDVTSTRQHTQGEPSTAAAASSVRLAEQLHESSLLGDTKMKAEEIEIHEEGFS